MSQESEWKRELAGRSHQVQVDIPASNWRRIREVAKAPDFTWEGKSESDFLLWCVTKVTDEFLQSRDGEWSFNTAEKHHSIRLELTSAEWAGIWTAAQTNQGWTGTSEADFIMWCVRQVLREYTAADQAMIDFIEDPESTVVFNEGEDAELKDDGTIKIPSDILNAIGTAPGPAKVRVSNGTIVIEPPACEVKRWEEDEDA